MKILVFDDSHIHRTAAQLTLTNHELTIVGTYDEAREALIPKRNSSKANIKLRELLVEAGLPVDFEIYGKNKDAPKGDHDKYWTASNEANEFATTYPDFEAVLTDLLVPASGIAQGPDGDKYVGKEMPLGTIIALFALTVGIKNVAVVTDMNHHCHPASAAFDPFGWSQTQGVNILCTNQIKMVGFDEKTHEVISSDFLRSSASNGKYPYKNGNGYGERAGLCIGKDWAHALDRLLGKKTMVLGA